jgi:hypothetical protein
MKSRAIVSETKYLRNRDRRKILIMISFYVALLPMNNAIIIHFRSLKIIFGGAVLYLFVQYTYKFLYKHNFR